MSKGRLKTCLTVLLGFLIVGFSCVPIWAASDEETVAQMQKDLQALKAELESLRSEMKSDKEVLKAHDEELLASKQEFSQLSSDVRNWKANPEAVETLKDQIKKELGVVPNVYNELANKIRLGFELRTRLEYENNWHTIVAHQLDPLAGTHGSNFFIASPFLEPYPVLNDPRYPDLGQAGPTVSGGGVSEDNTIVLNRVRFNIDADVHEHLRTFVQFQDSRFWGIENGVVGFDGLNFGGAFQGTVQGDDPNNRIDLHQAYVDIKKLFNPNLTFRVGRQEIIWGDHRMMGDFGWSNIGITWDAIRAMWDTERYGAEAFAAIVRESSLGRSSPIGFTPTGSAFSRDRDDDDRHVYGAMFTFKKLIPDGKLQLMYLMDNDMLETGAERPGLPETPGQIGELEVHDFGFRAEGRIGKPIDYAVEYHFQTGEWRGRAHEAMALAIEAGYQFQNVMWKPRLGYEFDWSPGDGGANRGKHHTFHNFYPTNHKHYGYIDLVSWKNIVAHRFQAKVWPTKKLTAWVDFWNFSVENSNDAWYNAGQVGLLRMSPTAGGEIGNHLGNEIDLTVNYSLYKNVGILAGYSKFLSGTFIDKLTGPDTVAGGVSAASDNDTDWGFLQLTVSF